MIVAAHQGDTVDALCFRALGRTAGVTEAAYGLNRGLAAIGPVLPEGTLVTLPEKPAETPQTRDIVQLWD